MEPATPTNLETMKARIYRPKVEHFFLKMLIYGEGGVGKTTFASTAKDYPLTKEVLFVNIEGGTLSIAGLVDTIDLRHYTELEDIFWFLVKSKHQYKTVVIDSLSELQLMNLDEIMNIRIEQKSSNSGKVQDNINDIWQEDYGKSTVQIRRDVRRFRDLPMHTIFTCLAKDKQDKDKNEKVMPALTPKLVTSVVGYMDVVGYLYVQSEDDGSISRKMLCQPYDKWTAKDRSPGGRLGMVVDNPTVPHLMNLILGKPEKKEVEKVNVKKKEKS